MEFWILYAIISAVLVWVANFWIKVSVERWYDVHLYSLYANGLSFFLFVWILFFQWSLQSTLQNTSSFIILLGAINIILLTLSVGSRAKSLENIDTVIFYPIYKTLGPILATIASIYFFHESLNLQEWLGIWVWIVVPLLLITRTENRIQKNLFLWILFILVTVAFTSIASAMPKIIQVRSLDIDSFLLSAFCIGTIFSFGFSQFHKKKQVEAKKQASIYFWMWLWLCHFGAMYLFSHALVWNFAIVYTINSFSILIPIVLSIIFYGEHFNLKKWIVIVLSIVSILLFI